MSTEQEERGPAVAVTCVFLVAGAALAYWIDFGFTRMDNQISWVSRPWSNTIILVTELTSSTANSHRISGPLCPRRWWYHAVSPRYSSMVLRPRFRG